MECEFQSSFVKGKSYSSSEPDKFIFDKYDFFLICSSWDRRCLEITKNQTIRAIKSVLLLFKGRDIHGFRDKHDPIIEKFVEEISDSYEVINESSEKLDSLWSKILNSIFTIANELKRPINILIDLSTCPRYYAFGIIGAALKLGLANKITIFYSEGRYYKEHGVKKESTSYDFTLGKWDTVAIPYLKTTHDPEKTKYYLVSVGFEGTKTMQVVNRKCPDRISLLFPSPGVISEYEEKAFEENKTLIESYQLPDKQIIKAHAGDAISAWKKIMESNIERPERENTHYLCCGTKPHGLALTLSAVCNGYATVLYRVPLKHAFVEVNPIGKYWIYEIIDVSALI